jgi:hypothetical protein
MNLLAVNLLDHRDPAPEDRKTERSKNCFSSTAGRE